MAEMGFFSTQQSPGPHQENSAADEFLGKHKNAAFLHICMPLQGKRPSVRRKRWTEHVRWEVVGGFSGVWIMMQILGNEEQVEDEEVEEIRVDRCPKEPGCEQYAGK